MVEGRRKLNLTPRELMHVHRAGIRFRSAIVVALASGSFIVRVAVTIRRVPKRHHSHCTERLRRRQQPRDEKYSATPSRTPFIACTDADRTQTLPAVSLYSASTKASIHAHSHSFS